MSNPLFTSIPLPKVSRNTFKLSHNNKFTMTAQKLYPVMLLENLPGDRHLVFSELMARAQPLVSPVYQSYNISQHAFFVPMRTLSKNWEQFITGGKDGTYTDVMPYTTYGDIYDVIQLYFQDYIEVEQDTPLEVVPSEVIQNLADLCDVIRQLDFAGLSFSYSSQAGASLTVLNVVLADTAAYRFVSDWINRNASYLGNDVPINLLPFKAMLKIWSEYYRDENVVDDPLEAFEEVHHLDTAVGLQAINQWSIEDFCTLFKMRPRAWKKDRYTSALPFTQRGPDVLLPIAGKVDVTPAVTGSGTIGSGYSITTGGRLTPGSDEWFLNASGAGNTTRINKLGTVDFDEAELTTTINDFRRAERLQRWYENSARGGSRLNENTLAHWGVHTPDATLDRAVFLGGLSQPLVIGEVDQTSATDETSPQGNLAGKGTSYNSGKLFKHYDPEHGYIIVFASVLQHADYMQGTPRIFTRQDRYEYAWPEFANLGEEPIMTRELYTLAGNNEVFGYTPRYSDYKSMPSEVHGDMRTSLAHWAVPRIFNNLPALNEEFIYKEPEKIAFAVESGEVDEFVCLIRFAMKDSRLLPFYGVPTI